MSDFEESAKREPNPNIMILQPVKADEVLKRGRPKTRVQPDDVYKPPSSTSSTSSYTPGLKKPAPKSPRDKKREIEDLATKIVEDLNEGIIEALTTVGIPAEFLYKNGKAPIPTVSSKYTDLGNMLCVSPLQANWMAHGWFEAKDIPAIKRFVGDGNKEGPSYIWMALGGLGAAGYLSQLVKAVNALNGIKDELKKIQTQQEHIDIPEERQDFSQSE